MVLKRAADLAEALYSMPPRAAGHHFALSSSPAAAAAAGPAPPSQLTLAPTSPVSASSSPAVAVTTHLTSVTAGFNGYPGHAGDYHQQNFGWDDSWTHRYHQAFSFWRHPLLTLLLMLLLLHQLAYSLQNLSSCRFGEKAGEWRPSLIESMETSVTGHSCSRCSRFRGVRLHLRQIGSGQSPPPIDQN